MLTRNTLLAPYGTSVSAAAACDATSALGTGLLGLNGDTFGVSETDSTQIEKVSPFYYA